jgi:hypothetical protein
MKPSEMDETDLISLCKAYYKGNESELKLIRQFQQTYSSEKAIRWYTNECFLYKLLNKALRTEDINIIFLFQFFIHDLHQQTTEYQCQYPIRVYRSQHLGDDEINSLKESVGCFISVNGFYSTTFTVNTALGFLGNVKQLNASHRVLFEIDADPKVVTTKPFTDISEHSSFPQEREVLFSIGSLFRITNVQQSDSQMWIIRMTLCDDDDPDLRLLFEKINKKYGYYDGDAAFILFSRVLREMKKFDEAEKYCHRLLRDFSSNDPLLGILYDELAEIASSKSDYSLSDQWHQKAIKIKKKTGSSSVGSGTGAVSYNGKHVTKFIEKCSYSC